MCNAGYQLSLFGENVIAYRQQFFSDKRHRILIRPTDKANILRLEDEKPVMRALHWGLVPNWSRDGKMTANTFNAREDTVQSKATYRDAFAKRRCLLVWDSYVEWRTEGAVKVPYEFSMA